MICISHNEIAEREKVFEKMIDLVNRHLSVFIIKQNIYMNKYHISSDFISLIRYVPLFQLAQKGR